MSLVRAVTVHGGVIGSSLPAVSSRPPGQRRSYSIHPVLVAAEGNPHKPRAMVLQAILPSCSLTPL